MQRSEVLRAEFEHEAQTTRTHLARVPEDQFDWKPHPRSYTARQLASHLVDCVRFAPPIFGAPELDVDVATYRPFRATAVQDLLDTFDLEVGRALDALANTDDTDATQPWRLLINGRLHFERPREIVFRDMTLSHLIHHRGQLTVYLRLLDVPVPGSYGSTADEK